MPRANGDHGITVGSVWMRKRGMQGHHALVVEVVGVTVNNVTYKEPRDPRVYVKPISQFLGMFERYDAPQKQSQWCVRCGSMPVRNQGDRYCPECIREISIFRTARTPGPKPGGQDGPVLVIMPPRGQLPLELVPTVIEVDQGMPEPSVATWRVTGKRVVVTEETVEINAKDLVDVAAEVERRFPAGFEIDSAQRIVQPNGHARSAA
jgi:hypothetical protein